jgi:hypothetical protein
MIQIVPRYKVLVCYDIKPRDDNEYLQFVLNDFVPKLQGMGLYMWRVYHTAYGNYPIRQLEFLAEELDTVRNAMQSAEWQDLEAKLRHYVTNLYTKVFAFRDGFQF